MPRGSSATAEAAARPNGNGRNTQRPERSALREESGASGLILSCRFAGARTGSDVGATITARTPPSSSERAAWRCGRADTYPRVAYSSATDVSERKRRWGGRRAAK